ncbi:MAG: putative sugar O-methyltransferase, partial [Romboutsia sp.]|nr:putative sugar O-methyltransferase [Romboutsia sp.]
MQEANRDLKMDIIDRVHKAFLLSKNLAHSTWDPVFVFENIKLAHQYLEHKNNYKELLNNLGQGSNINTLQPILEKDHTTDISGDQFFLAKGLNLSPHFEINKSKHDMYNFLEKLKDTILAYTNLDLSNLISNNCFNAFGNHLADQKILLPIMCKLAYNMHVIKNILETEHNKEIIILEIGAGIGSLPLLCLNNIPNVSYIIVDIPHTSVIASYFLHENLKNICLYGEYQDLSIETIKKYDCLIIPSEDIKKIPNKSIDLVV